MCTFLRVGFTEEATRFRDWLTARYKEPRLALRRAASAHVRDRRLVRP